jgi:hypothetical protein
MDKENESDDDVDEKAPVTLGDLKKFMNQWKSPQNRSRKSNRPSVKDPSYRKRAQKVAEEKRADEGWQRRSYCVSG